MRIFGFNTCPDPVQNYDWTKSKHGIVFGLRGGDVIYPWGGNWFDPPYFKHYLHFFLPLPILPYFSLRIGRFGFYIGAKAFGVDVEAYKNWLPPGEVFIGSQAIMLASIRFSSHIGLP